MIKNDRQYQLSRAEVRRFAKALDALMAERSDDALLREVEIDAVRSQLESLRSEVAEYEALRTNDTALIEVESFAELPRALIKARIASGLTQRVLAERLGMKEQQVQRYEANDYTGASLSRIEDVASALGVTVRNEVEMPGRAEELRRVRRRLVSAGVDGALLDRRLLSRKQWTQLTVANLIARLAAVFHISVDELTGDGPIHLALQPALSPSFKVPASASEARVTSHALFARYLAGLVIQSTPTMASQTVPSDWEAFRSAVISHSGELTFEGVVNFLWHRGVVVLPMSEPGGFHAAYWRIAGRDVIVLKQSSRSTARWLFDVLHETHHAVTSPDSDRVVIEEWDEEVDAADDEEVAANTFAGNVIFAGQAEVLAGEAVEDAHGRLEGLKAATRKIGARHNVDVGSLANYLAWRLSLQGENWWGVAHNLQDENADAWAIARDQLILNIDPSLLERSDYELLSRTLEEVDS